MSGGNQGLLVIVQIWLGSAAVTQESCLQLILHFLISNSLSDYTWQNSKTAEAV